MLEQFLLIKIGAMDEESQYVNFGPKSMTKAGTYLGRHVTMISGMAVQKEDNHLD